VDAAGLGDVVARLLLREVGDEAGHGCRDDQRPGFAFAEVHPDGAGAVGASVQVGVDDFFPLCDGGVEDAVVGGFAGVGDEDVDFAEVFDDGVDEGFDAGVLVDLAFVGFAFDGVFFGEVFGVLFAAGGAGGVGDGDVGAHFGAAAGGLVGGCVSCGVVGRGGGVGGVWEGKERTSWFACFAVRNNMFMMEVAGVGYVLQFQCQWDQRRR